jgi:hypothetical protein
MSSRQNMTNSGVKGSNRGCINYERVWTGSGEAQLEAGSKRRRYEEGGVESGVSGRVGGGQTMARGGAQEPKTPDLVCL